jgi:hypothetical protein
LKKRHKKTAFVPSVVFGTVVFGVVPACALSCGGSTTGPGSGDAAGDTMNHQGVADVGFSVAAVGYCGFCDAGPDANADAQGDAMEQPDVPFTVAQCGFCDGGDGG